MFGNVDIDSSIESYKKAFDIVYLVAVIAPTVPAMYEAHFGIVTSGAVLYTVNVRLNAQTVAFLLDHSHADVIMVDQEYFTLAIESLKIIANSQSKYKSPLMIVIDDQNIDPKSLNYALSKEGVIEYEKFLESGDPQFSWEPPIDGWQSIALGYTSGTPSSPKGVVLLHRGSYLMALSSPIVWKELFFFGLCLCFTAMIGVFLGH